VFCDGDFWHGRDWARRKRKLRTGNNPSYWVRKIERNIERDGEVPAGLAGERVDRAAAVLFPEFSRAVLSGWLRSGALTVDGCRLPPKTRLLGGEVLRLRAALAPREDWQTPQPVPFEVLYEDEALLVLDKPAGVVVHPGAGHRDGTLVNGLLAHRPQLAELPRAGIVHRLDKDTSGVMVVARTPEARDIIMKMAERADVVVQNFRPGVMARMGFGYEDFKSVNPRIVYCSGSGYGEDGPYVNRPGQDMLVQGLTGIMAATGQADQPPTPVGAGFSDQVGAMNMVYGILTALLWRERSGKGQQVKVNLLAGMLAHQNQEMVMAMNFNEDFQRPNSGSARR